MDHKIEYVARAFYNAEDDAQSWEHEPEILKEEFRRYAREAIAMLAQASGKDLHEFGEFEFSYAA
jgi:hypothetical protein